MKTPARIQFVLTAGAALAITALTAYSGDKLGKGGNHGTDIIHLSIQTQMENGGILTNASGQARINWNQQGNANHQSLQVNVHPLHADTSYELDAFFIDTTTPTPAL